jgi:allophanate hydrolase
MLPRVAGENQPALPALNQIDERKHLLASNLPCFINNYGRAFGDDFLADLGAQFLGEPRPSIRQEYVDVSVVGAHLSGQPLNHQLTSRGARLIKTCRTAASYRLFALAKTTPPKPGLVRTPGFSGSGIETEVWRLSRRAFGEFVAEVPAPMGIGTVTLDDGSEVKGFLCEVAALDGARDITEFGGWRGWLRAAQRLGNPGTPISAFFSASEADGARS